LTPAEAVLDLSGIRISDAGRVGPKVARLGQLAHAGWRVPDGYAVTVDALAAWLPRAAREDLGRLLASGPAATGEHPHRRHHEHEAHHRHLAHVAAQARELIEGQPLPGWLEDAVAAAHERLAGRAGQQAAELRVAVRSSALAEDGASASFAGQYATYLGVSGIADVLAHIRKCWASGFTAHALAYRSSVSQKASADAASAAAGTPDGDAVAGHLLAVGVLELVDVRSAGVVFTMDPVSGDRDRLVVEANWGFGESVVSGHVTPDHWEVDRATGHILAEHVTAKRSWSVFDAGAVALRPLPPELAGQACLAAQEVRYLCRAAAQIEEAEDGVPQDVEWAIAHGLPFPDSVYILQHRPETTWTHTQEPARDAAPVPQEPEAAPPPAAAVPPGNDAPQPPAPAPKAFDPVAYALRNVFRVPGS
jgi:pyruvate,water dikinase